MRGGQGKRGTGEGAGGAGRSHPHTWLSGSQRTMASSCARRFSSSAICREMGGRWDPQPQKGAAQPLGVKHHAHLGSLGELVLLWPPEQFEGERVSGGRRGFGGALCWRCLLALGYFQLLLQAPVGGEMWGSRARGLGGTSALSTHTPPVPFPKLLPLIALTPPGSIGGFLSEICPLFKLHAVLCSYFNFRGLSY